MNLLKLVRALRKLKAQKDDLFTDDPQGGIWFPTVTYILRDQKGLGRFMAKLVTVGVELTYEQLLQAVDEMYEKFPGRIHWGWLYDVVEIHIADDENLFPRE